MPGGRVEWGVPHPALQEALLNHAADRDARVLRPARAVNFRRPAATESELEVTLRDQALTVRARLVVGSDGSRSAVRRWLGAATERDPVHHAIGGCLIDGVALDEDCTHQAYVPGGMVIVFPQG